MAFAPGTRVHILHVGTGVVREVRNSGRYLVEIKGRTMVVDEAEMEDAGPARAARGKKERAVPDTTAERSHAAASIDLHGKTVEEAIAALDSFLNDALLASVAEVRVIHGRSGGRLKAAVHKRLRALPPVRSFRVDPRNPGVTIVSL